MVDSEDPQPEDALELLEENGGPAAPGAAARLAFRVARERGPANAAALSALLRAEVRHRIETWVEPASYLHALDELLTHCRKYALPWLAQILERARLPEEHRRQRAAVTAAYRDRSMAALEPTAEQIGYLRSLGANTPAARESRLHASRAIEAAKQRRSPQPPNSRDEGDTP